MVDLAKLTEIREDIRGEVDQAPYRAYNGLWLALVKMANLLPGTGPEHEQVRSLVRTLSRQEAAAVLADPGLDRLLELDPPLETLLADSRERLNSQSAAEERQRIAARRTRDPKAALDTLLETLGRIRDKREHGFKSARGPRDAEVLGAGVAILQNLCGTLASRLALQVDGPASSQAASWQRDYRERRQRSGRSASHCMPSPMLLY